MMGSRECLCRNAWNECRVRFMKPVNYEATRPARIRGIVVSLRDEALSKFLSARFHREGSIDSRVAGNQVAFQPNKADSSAPNRRMSIFIGD